MPSRSEELVVDRIACTGHGICASLLPDTVTLDEWGYPVVAPSPADSEMTGLAIRTCPARALARRSHG